MRIQNSNPTVKRVFGHKFYFIGHKFYYFSSISDINMLPFAAGAALWVPLTWRGWHYRYRENDVLRYWLEEAMTIRPSPVSEALIWVYWRGDILCCAIAEELCHKNGHYRPY